MLAARLTAPNRLEIAQIDDPTPGPGGALIRVHAAAITRDELTWPLDRLPAIPSYESRARLPPSDRVRTA